jgi:hypothetical protein
MELLQLREEMAHLGQICEEQCRALQDKLEEEMEVSTALSGELDGALRDVRSALGNMQSFLSLVASLLVRVESDQSTAVLRTVNVLLEQLSYATTRAARSDDGVEVPALLIRAMGVVGEAIICAVDGANSRVNDIGAQSFALAQECIQLEAIATSSRRAAEMALNQAQEEVARHKHREAQWHKLVEHERKRFATEARDLRTEISHVRARYSGSPTKSEG